MWNLPRKTCKFYNICTRFIRIGLFQETRFLWLLDFIWLAYSFSLHAGGRLKSRHQSLWLPEMAHDYLNRIMLIFRVYLAIVMGMSSSTKESRGDSCEDFRRPGKADCFLSCFKLCSFVFVLFIIRYIVFHWRVLRRIKLTTHSKAQLGFYCTHAGEQV